MITLTYTRDNRTWNIGVPCNSHADLLNLADVIDKHFVTKPPMDPRRWAGILKVSSGR